MLLVVFSSVAGVVMAPGYIPTLSLFISVVCVAIGSGAAGALNMWYDSDIDAIMQRTQGRAIPSGMIHKDDVLRFGIVLSIISVATMGFYINYLSALLLALAILFYSVVYTVFLKRHTHHNIVIGGVAGALPPVIGWAAVSNSIAIESIILFLMIFLWTPPHFWALSLFRSGEYKRAGVPMLPVVRGEKKTRKYILLYVLLLVPVTLVPYFIDMSGILYSGVALIVGAMFFIYSYAVYLQRMHPYQLFKFSILYLFLLLVFMILDKIYVL